MLNRRKYENIICLAETEAMMRTGGTGTKPGFKYLKRILTKTNLSSNELMVRADLNREGITLRDVAEAEYLLEKNNADILRLAEKLEDMGLYTKIMSRGFAGMNLDLMFSAGEMNSAGSAWITMFEKRIDIRSWNIFYYPIIERDSIVPTSLKLNRSISGMSESQMVIFRVFIKCKDAEKISYEDHHGRVPEPLPERISRDLAYATLDMPRSDLRPEETLDVPSYLMNRELSADLKARACLGADFEHLGDVMDEYIRVYHNLFEALNSLCFDAVLRNVSEK